MMHKDQEGSIVSERSEFVLGPELNPLYRRSNMVGRRVNFFFDRASQLHVRPALFFLL